MKICIVGGGSDVWVRVGGINHLPWISEMRVNGRDGLAMLREWLAEHGPDHFAQNGLDNTPDSVFLATGMLPGAGDRHVVEFFPHFVRQEKKYGLDYGAD